MTWRPNISDFSHSDIDEMLENYSPYSVLRLLAENPANLELEVRWSFGNMIEAGWGALRDIALGAPGTARFLIVTEGSSDAKIVEHALRLLRPHLSDFFRFVEALLQNRGLGRDFPFPRRCQATRTISAVPRAEKRFIRAMGVWISAV